MRIPPGSIIKRSNPPGYCPLHLCSRSKIEAVSKTGYFSFMAEARAWTCSHMRNSIPVCGGHLLQVFDLYDYFNTDTYTVTFPSGWLKEGGLPNSAKYWTPTIFPLSLGISVTYYYVTNPSQLTDLKQPPFVFAYKCLGQLHGPQIWPRLCPTWLSLPMCLKSLGRSSEG